MATQILPPSELQELIDRKAEWCVSLFLPTHPAGNEIQQDPIRLKNLLREAEDLLVERGMRRNEAQGLLEPAARRVGDGMFWRHQSDGLAIFIGPDFHREYHLPLVFEPLAVVADHFETKPLLPLLINDGRYYVLALSGNQVRLLQATRHNVSRIDVPDLPESMADALSHDDPERSLQFHTGTGQEPSRGTRAAVFHGQGAAGDKDREGTDLWRYFQRIDRALEEALADESAPMVLAAVDHEQALFREVASYDHILPDGVSGSPDRLSDEELRKAAWERVEPHFRKAEREAAERFGSLSETDRAADGVASIVPAAWWGRVDTLFLERNRHVWGSFDPDSNTVEVTAEEGPQAGEADLLELAAQRTLAQGGTVYAVERSQMPTGEPVAAVLRYPVRGQPGG